MNDAEKLQKIKELAQSFNYWRDMESKASELFCNIIEIIDDTYCDGLDCDTCLEVECPR